MLKIDLSGKIAVVTGATGQLGRVMVRTLAECGADVAVHYYQNQSVAVQLKDELEQMGRNSCVVQADVASMAAVWAMRDVIENTLGAPDIVVTNAVSQIFPWQTVLAENLDDYQDQFNTCVMHNVCMAKAFVPGMVQKKAGRFIGINTECAMQADVTQSAYASAKRGMDGVLRVLAKEVGPDGVTVNQVAPGWTVSYKDRENGTEQQPEYTENVPLRRRGTDREVAQTVAFLASDLAAFTTGAYIPVCGGNVMPAI